MSWTGMPRPFTIQIQSKWWHFTVHWSVTLKIGALAKLGLFFPMVCFIYVFDQTSAEQVSQMFQRFFCLFPTASSPSLSLISSTCWFRLYTSRRSYKVGCCTHQFPAHSLCRCIPEHSYTCSYSRGQHMSRRFCRVAVHTRWCLVRISVQCNLACIDTGTRRVCRHMSLRFDMGCWNTRLSQFHSLFLEILRAVKWKVEHLLYPCDL